MGRSIGFYQHFALDLQRLAYALGCVQQSPLVGVAELAACMGVNRPVAEGYLGWLRHCGLGASGTSNERRQSQPYSLTSAGRLIAEHDPGLRNLATLWLLHYYLATDHQERSDAWQVLINEFLAPGRVFTAGQYTNYFVSVKGRDATNRSTLERDPKEALGTYVRPQALGRLGILVRDEESYRVSQTALPALPILAYMLFDWWDRHYPHTTVLRRTQLSQEPGSIGRVCVVNSSGMDRLIRELSGRDYIHFKATEHEPVSRLYMDSPLTLLEEYYGSHD